MRFLTLMMTLLLVPSVYADQNPKKPPTYTDVPVELKGILLGSSVDAAKEMFPTADCVNAKEVGTMICTIEKASFAESQSTLTMSFIDGSLHRYSFSNIPISKYQLVFDSLSTKYGKPARNAKADNGLVRELGPGNYVKGIDFWRNPNKDTLFFQFDPNKMYPTKFDVVVKSAQYGELISTRQSPTGEPKKVTTDI